MSIDFIPIERNCQYNKDIPANSKKRRIFDYDLVIDGERRAVLSQLHGVRSWRLLDIHGNIIYQAQSNPNNFHRYDIRLFNPERFAQDVQKYLDLIPTLAQIEQLKRDKADEGERKRFRLKLRAWNDRVSGQSLAMYELIKLFQDQIGEPAKRIINYIEKEENNAD